MVDPVPPGREEPAPRGNVPAAIVILIATVLYGSYLLWIGFAGQGDGELYRVRCVIDPVLLAGLFLPLDPDAID